MQTTAVVLEEPKHLRLKRLELDPIGASDVVVAIEWSGISTGTERLLWSGRMPHFPGMGYPLVPGYESVGRICAVGDASNRQIGERVFVPGARCFGEVRGLFGGAASHVVVPENRATQVPEQLGEDAILLALAATAYHAIAAVDARPPDLIIGHGVLGRLLARVTIALGHPAPLVWERQAQRAAGASNYRVVDPANDPRTDYGSIYDVSGDSTILDTLIGRLAGAGQVVLAGFYTEPLSFSFAPAFMRESRIRIAAEWRPADLTAIQEQIRSGALDLSGLITHRCAAEDAAQAYRTAFEDPLCLKMALDWRGLSSTSSNA